MSGHEEYKSSRSLFYNQINGGLLGCPPSKGHSKAPFRGTCILRLPCSVTDPLPTDPYHLLDSNPVT